MNKQRTKGVALIEFALVLPLLLAIVVGILYYGFAFVLLSSAQNSARLGAEAAVSLDPLTGDYSKAVIERAENAANNSLPSWLPGDPEPASATLGEPAGADEAGSCQDVGDNTIVVNVVIKPNAGERTLLPTLSIGDFQIPPGLETDDGQPTIKANACAQL